jgi:RNA polymerase sigma-70 factor (ECF subfamily)
VFGNKKNDLDMDELFNKHYEYIFKVILSVVLDYEVAKDVTQETFMKAFLRIETLRDKDKFDKWIYSIAINTCKDSLRKTSKLKAKSTNLDDVKIIKDPSFLPDEIFEHKETKKEVVKCIKELDEKTQQIINLKYYLGFTYEEISKFMNISLSNVKIKLHRSKKKILSKLGTGLKKEAL